MMHRKSAPVDTDAVVRRFGRFLEASWPLIEEADDADFYSDFTQANWELLVERPHLGAVLAVYGDGADVNGASSRITRPQALPTHEVRCVARADVVTNVLDGRTHRFVGPVLFDRFVTVAGTWYAERPPFGHVLLVVPGSEPFVAHRDDVLFVLAPTPSPPVKGAPSDMRSPR